jgi:ABC-type transporter lipoprotein component MlaA
MAPSKDDTYPVWREWYLQRRSEQRARHDVDPPETELQFETELRAAYDRWWAGEEE